jgi:hypothetical protein
MTQDDDPSSLSSVAKTSPGCRGMFFLVKTSEMLLTRTTRDVWSGTICESSVESAWCVDQVFPCRVYIDLNRRNSQI